MAQRWLVAVDGSKNAESAFNYALEHIDATNDELLLITVSEKLQTHLYTHAYVR